MLLALQLLELLRDERGEPREVLADLFGHERLRLLGGQLGVDRDAVFAVLPHEEPARLAERVPAADVREPEDGDLDRLVSEAHTDHLDRNHAGTVSTPFGSTSGARGPMDLVFFILLVGALVLVHELGHFLAARAFGVKVLTFSLGFGPALLRFRGRETTYQLALLPFGGFVKLLEDRRHRRALDGDGDGDGDDGEPEPDIAPEDRGRTYEAQPLLRRALIALAGPAMNVVVPLFLFFAVFLDGGRRVPPVVGVVVAGTPAEGVLQAGDRVLAIDGQDVHTYEELHAKIAASPGRKLSLRVARTIEQTGKPVEQVLDVAVVPRSVVDVGGAFAQRSVGRLGIGPSPLAAAVGVDGPSSPAFRAGLRTFDVVTHVGGIATTRFADLERRLRDNAGVAVPVSYLRPLAVPVPSGSPLLELAAYEARVAILAPEPRHDGVAAGADDGLRRAGLESTDLYVASVPEGSSEWRAGLREGDRIRTLDGKPVTSWQALAWDLVEGGDRARELGWTREGRPMTGVLRVRKEEWTDGAGEKLERYVFRSTHWTPTVPLPLVEDPSPLRRAVRDAVFETAHVSRFLATSVVRLVRGELTLKSISGPITIYDVAGRAGARGARDFLWVMALISINLGLLNLLPIPTLDGGQLLYLAIERVTGRPVPIRVREVTSIVGLVLLLAIMAIAFVNDLGAVR